MIDCYAVPGELTSPKWAASFAAGCGGRYVQDGSKLYPGDVAMFGSPARWEILQEAIAAGRTWYYGDHAYFQRFKFYRVTKNAYQHTGRGESTGERFKRFGRTVDPWRTGGADIMICPPGDAFAGLHGFAPGEWLKRTTGEIRRHTDRNIVVRGKPQHGQGGDLRTALWNCHALVTFMSNAAVEAVLYGVPVFVTGDCAALTMGSNDLSMIESPRRPDGRREWAGVLADNQWTLDEIANGDAWRAIGAE